MNEGRQAAEKILMTDVQFHELPLRLDGIICDLERIVPAVARADAESPVKAASRVGEIYWIESKTAADRHYVRQHSQMARMFGLGHHRSSLDLADAPGAVYLHLSWLTGMTICLPEQFYGTFLQLARRQQPPQPAAQ